MNGKVLSFDVKFSRLLSSYCRERPLVPEKNDRPKTETAFKAHYSPL
jgi:hypothetical protein